jgi:hypothetical protein
MISIWSYSYGEFRFYWRREIATFATLDHARTVVEPYKKDPVIVSKMANIISKPGYVASSDDEIMEHIARMLVDGDLLVWLYQFEGFDPIPRYDKRSFRSAATRRHFVEQFKNDRIAMTHLRELMFQQNAFRSLDELNNDGLMEEVGKWLGVGEMVVGVRSFLKPGTKSSEGSGGPAPAAARPAMRPEPAPQEEDEEPTFVSPDSDAQAAALRAAALSGVPFCEECPLAARRPS